MRHLLEDRVAVLLDELLRGVGHRRDKVGEREVVARVEACAPLLVELGELGGADGVLLVEEGAEGRVLAAVAEPALLVQQGEHSVRQVLDGGHDRAVVGHLDGRPLDLLCLVVRLLVVEDGVEEEALQLLVGQVDEQLLERVRAEDLEAEDVEEADPLAGHARAVGGRRRARRRHALVDGLDDPREEAVVHALAQRIARAARLLGVERLVVHGRPCARLDAPHSEDPAEAGHAQQRLRLCNHVRVRHLGRALGVVLLDDLKGDVAEVQDAGEDGEHVVWPEAERLHGRVGRLELVHVVEALAHARPSAREVVEARRVAPKVELGEGAVVEPREQLVEDVEVGLAGLLQGEARLLEEVGGDVGARDAARVVKEHAHELAEARRVWVHHGGRVAKRLKDRRRVEHRLRHRRALRALLARPPDEVLEEVLVRLGLARARDARNDDRLVAARLA
mmetsp:Transcript_35054/g.112605  ORF Transcript_35054/g.112605 Transcript_35054/m.112605 type:complete len:450 (+) Transcript_35054:2377-3726(+)